MRKNKKRNYRKEKNERKEEKRNRRGKISVKIIKERKERKKEQSNTEFFKKSVVREPKLYKNWSHAETLKDCPSIKMESRRDFKRLH